MLASVDGTIGPAEEARIPVTDEGLTRGDGGSRSCACTRAGRSRWPTTWLGSTGRAPGLRLPYDEALQAEIGALLEAAGPVDALLRVVLTRGGRRLLTIEPMPEADARLAWRRSPTRRRACSTASRPFSYAGNMLAGRLARERGFDEALLVTPHGRVLEGPTWTFFWVAAAGC